MKSLVNLLFACGQLVIFLLVGACTPIMEWYHLRELVETVRSLAFVLYVSYLSNKLPVLMAFSAKNAKLLNLLKSSSCLV